MSNGHAFSHHREMPVDVPDSFVGVVKQQPRYPPPPPPQRYATSVDHHGQMAINNNRVNSEKLRKYSDEIFKKKEEDEFLRSSLRNSKKLQQLKERNAGQFNGEPMVNIAFEPDEEVLVAYNNHAYAPSAKSLVQNRYKERESDKGLLIASCSIDRVLILFRFPQKFCL